MYEKNLDRYTFCDLSEDYVDQTAHLLNQEWPRSLNLRRHNLKASIASTSDSLTLPVSLILIEVSSNHVIGHASIASIAVISDRKSSTEKIVDFENLAFLQSVIIDKERRGKGLGKKLMHLCENYLIDYGKQESAKKTTDFNCMYLTTRDKQSFYESIGYSRIEPIKFYTVKTTKCTEIMRRLYSKKNENELDANAGDKSLSQNVEFLHPNNFPIQPPPPPPPPLPFAAASSIETASKTTDLQTIWYKKCLNE